VRGVDVDRHRLADGRLLQRVGLHAQHLAGLQFRIIFTDIAKKEMRSASRLGETDLYSKRSVVT
jgi:hypothetical protein